MMRKQQAGFTLMETMVALVILLGVSAVVMSGMIQMMRTEGTITNRTEMHTSVRSATELLQQEIGQAGKIALPTPPPGVAWAMLTQVNVPADQPVTIVGGGVTFNVLSPANAPIPNSPVLFEGEWITVDTGLNKETVQLKCPAGPGNCPNPSNNWNATFYYTHLPIAIPGTGTFGVPINVPGSFSTGIIPPAVPALPGALPVVPTGYAGYPANFPTAGSTGTVLKLYGDVNGDGNMVYVEYTCVQGTAAAPGFLYRNQIDINQNFVPPLNPSMIVLTGVLQNPNGPNGTPVPCFTYQLQTKDGVNAALNDMVFVTDVAVTLTVQTPNPDPQTNILQTETKALLNVSPRDVYDAYEFAQLDYLNRVQPTPMGIKTNILPNFQ
jgi:prepilin-type N-terminal cleavage/methylation domain-containing protein